MTVALVEYRKVSEGLGKAVATAGPGTVFVVPAREDGRILREALSRGDPKAPAASPWTISEFYRKTLAGLEEAGASPKWRRQVDPPDHWAILSFLLDGAFSEAGTADPPPPGARMPGFVPLLGAQLRELLREETSPEALGLSQGCAGCPEGSPCPKLSTPEGLLCRLFHAYDRYLSENGLADSAALPTLTREALQEHPAAASAFLAGRRFVFAGFLSFTHGQAALVRELERSGAPVTVLKPATGLEGFADAIDQLVLLADRTGPALELAPAGGEPFSALELVSGSAQLEPDTVARALALWSAGEGPLAIFPFPGWDGIAVQVSPAEAGRFESAFSRYRVPFSSADGLPVAATSPWSSARAVLEAAGAGWPPLETAALLSDPFFAGSCFPLREALRESPQGETSWTAFLKRLPTPSPALAFRRMVSFARVVGKGAAPAGLLGALRALWKTPGPAGGERSALAEGSPALDPFVRQASEAFRELERKILLEEERHPSIGPAADRLLRGTEARAYLSEWASETTVRPPAFLAGAVSLFTAPPPVWAGRSCFILSGATAKSWPGSLKEAPLLGDATRRTLNESGPGGLKTHLPLTFDRRLQQEALFRRLVASGESVTVLSRPATDEQGRPLDGTPFLEAAEAAGWTRSAGSFTRPLSAFLPRPGDAFFPQVEPRPGEARTIRRPLPPAASWDPGPAPKASLGDLETWMDCPFSYWALKLARLEEPVRGLFDPARAGIFLHTLWERTWAARLGGTREPLAALVEQSWEKAMADPRGGYPRLATDSRLARRARRLKEVALRLAVLQEEADRVMAPGRVDQLREFSMALEVGGVNFRGRADRVEVYADGFVVLDYKSGKVDFYKRSLQLAAYSAALEEVLGLPPLGTGFFGHADGRLYLALARDCRLPFTRGNGITIAKGETLEGSIERARAGMADMAAGILSGSFEAAHGRAEACPRCPARGLCRLGEARGESLSEEKETEETPVE